MKVNFYFFEKLLIQLTLKLSEKIPVHAFGVSACVTVLTFSEARNKL